MSEPLPLMPIVKREYRLAELLGYLNNGEILNQDSLTADNLNRVITGIDTLQNANASQLSFLANNHYRKNLPHTQAAAVLLTPTDAMDCPAQSIALITHHPYTVFAKLTELFAYQPSADAQSKPNIHPTAMIATSAKIGENVQIGAYCVIGENAIVGKGCQLASHVVIEDFAKIGDGCKVAAHVLIAHHCELGDNVTLHSHASIGNEGFGFAPKGDPATKGWQKIHQLGRVLIGDNVRIGSQTCIDRGTLDDTVIAENVIIDNLVQIAHNVHIGAGTAIAACVGIAGSSKVGKRCVLAGGVGLVGHIEICDDVTITGMTMVTKSITQKGSYSSGTPMMPTALWRKVAIKFKNLIE